MNINDKLCKFANYLDEWYTALPTEAKREMFKNVYMMGIDDYNDYWETLSFDDKVYYHDENYEEYSDYTSYVSLNLD